MPRTWGEIRIVQRLDSGEMDQPRIAQDIFLHGDTGNEAPVITGFTDPGETEFHYVAHTTEPDSENFPPHTAWIHLHFSDVEELEKPAEIYIPYATE